MYWQSLRDSCFRRKGLLRKKGSVAPCGRNVAAELALRNLKVAATW